MNRDSAADYAAAHRAVSELLYHVDPFEMGRSIDAPSDEYDEFAARLMAALKSAKTLQEARNELAGLGWELDPEIEQQVWTILDDADLHLR